MHDACHVATCMMRYFLGTNEPTNKAILGVGCTKDTAGQSANGLRGLPRVTYIDHDSDFERVLRPPARAGSDYKMKVTQTDIDFHFVLR